MPVAVEFEEFVEKLGISPNVSFKADVYENIIATLKAINQWCAGKSVRFVIAFDEAQYLRFGGRVKYDMMIAWSIDNLSNIAYILTGSEVGVLKEFLKYSNIKAPLYGRFRDEIIVERFSEENGKEFLTKGFSEAHIKPVESELYDTIEKIGGIAGWLTYYGNYRAIKKLSHKIAIEKVYSEGSKIVIGELDSLIAKSRNRYLYILKAMSNDITSWSGIKDYITGCFQRKPINLLVG